MVKDLIIGIAIDQVVDKFKGFVIERWTRYRSIQFFKAFLESYEKETGLYGSSSETNEMLVELLKDESKSEVLYESYRRVCLSKSKNIGPRIIGFLTAKLLKEEREANPEEELMFEAAERMSDDEFLDFESFYKRNNQNKEGNGSYIVKVISKESIDSNWSDGRDYSLGPVNLTSIVGKWAQVMNGIGILEIYMNERTTSYKEDGERHIDQDGYLKTVTWSISISRDYGLLCELIHRAA